jgi:hypothetical protein
MQDMNEIQETLKRIRTSDLWREIAGRLGLRDARLEMAIQGGEPVPFVTVTLPIETVDAVR